MLAITERAVSTIALLTDDPRVPDGAGVRIATADREGTLSIAVAAGPDEGDQVVSYDTAKVFLDEVAAQTLDDKLIDADVGEDGQIDFFVVQQPPQE
jgi:iron-sulfur cluster assembly protein